MLGPAGVQCIVLIGTLNLVSVPMMVIHFAKSVSVIEGSDDIPDVCSMVSA